LDQLLKAAENATK